MRVWIDFANSPHPLLFAPIVRALEQRGDDVVISVRDHAQTLELTRERWPDAVVVGGRSPGGRAAKAAALAARVADLRRFARRTRPDVALSHNSYAQIAAARASGVPVVTAMDYEYQPANHLAFRLANRVLLPRVVPLSVVRRQGATARKVVRYDGLKEELYIGDFEPDPAVLAHFGVARDGQPVVVCRSPPGGALYHRGTNPIFREAVAAVAADPASIVIVLARQPEERRALAEVAPAAVFPDHAIDALSLVYAADLVLGGGGTMTREAALLGVPTVSVFSGRRPTVDRWLEQRGRLRWISSADELGPVTKRPHEPRPLAELRVAGSLLTRQFVDVVRDHACR